MLLLHDAIKLWPEMVGGYVGFLTHATYHRFFHSFHHKLLRVVLRYVTRR